MPSEISSRDDRCGPELLTAIEDMRTEQPLSFGRIWWSARHRHPLHKNRPLPAPNREAPSKPGASLGVGMEASWEIALASRRAEQTGNHENEQNAANRHQ